MSTPIRYLQTLNPPGGGWERLIRRRDKESWLLPVAALTSAVAVVAFVLSLPHSNRIEFKLNGARLVGERSHGIALRMLDGRQTTGLPSEDPNVELYWIDGGKSQKPK